MNKVILIGRLAREPEIRYTAGNERTAVVRYTLAVDRRYNREQQSADFLSCVAFGKAAEFAEKYLHKGIKIAVTGRLQTGRYTNRDGITTYTTDVIIEEQEFTESKSRSEDSKDTSDGSRTNRSSADGFMQIPDDIDDELPFT